MVDEIQRQRQTPRTSNAMDNYYGFGRGLDVRNPQDLRRQQDAQAMKNPHHPIHANRNNMRGKDSYRVNVGPRPQRDTTGLGGLINRLDRRNIGYTDMLNALGSSFDPFSTGFGSPGGRFNEEYSDWEDKFGGDYDTLSGEHFRDSYTSSERQPGLEGNMGLRSLQQMANTNDPESNWRILQQMSPAQQEEYQTADASGIFDMYNEYKDKFGEYDFGDKEYSYDYEKEIGPGTLGIGGKYDFDDEEGKIGATYSMTFDDGGIATLPEFDIPDYMTKDHYMQQVVPKEKVPMTDDQKDYLYDYMLDFMFKQKQREQREMKGRILPFNYEGLEV
jgi:hypothetical protein